MAREDAIAGRAPWHPQVHPEIKKTIFAIVFFVLAFLFALSFVGKGGWAGALLFKSFDFLLGKGYFFAPLTSLLIAFSLFLTREKRVMGATFLGAFFWLSASLGALHILFGPRTGGALGMVFGSPLLRLFDFWVSLIIISGLFIISLLLLLNMPVWKREDSGGAEEEAGSATAQGAVSPENPEVVAAAAQGVKSVIEKIEERVRTALDKSSAGTVAAAAVSGAVSPTGEERAEIALRKVAKKFDYKKPPIELLQGDQGTPSSGDIRANSNIIKRTFENFNIAVDMGEVAVGPTVTQYALKPAEGVKLSRITALHNDLSLALAAHPIRIEAPIPGKSLVGIEVPNRSIARVGLRSLIEHPLFQEGSQPLLFSLGRDVAGAPVFADLAKMPHLLVSGATGSGKSVTIHTMVTSFVYRNPPEIVRFVIVDPKRVELTLYNDIPHLLTPVITDPKTTVQALRWATKEMDRRYDLLSVTRARDISSYNAKIAKDAEKEFLPYIVIMIDELADLMATFPREVESSIIRIAQMARAVGIHLVVATQRPSVEVITGLIKANITSRIALQVASQIDSRTILDIAGAEKLLGNGDMLFLAGDTAKPRRIQGAYISEYEVKRVVDFLREETEAPEYHEEIFEGTAEGRGTDAVEDLDGDDPLYDEARVLVMQAGKASASYLQRRLRVGYARAARLLDVLEGNGIIGPADGAKPREVFVKKTDEKGNGEYHVS